MDAINTIKSWIRRAIIYHYFPEVWYLIENWLAAHSNQKLLEIGCGRGVFTRALAQDGWLLTSVDSSEGSIDISSKRTKKRGLSVNYVHADPETLPFDDESFDAVTCINFLEFSKSPEMVLSEAYRVLKPNGKAVVAVFRPRTLWAQPWVSRSLRFDDPPKDYRCFNFQALKRIVELTDFDMDSYKVRGKYLPVQPSKGVLPWFTGGAIAVLLDKTPKRIEEEAT